MKKKLIIVALILSHLLCLLTGWFYGNFKFINKSEIAVSTDQTEHIVDENKDQIIPVETENTDACTSKDATVTEIPEETTVSDNATAPSEATTPPLAQPPISDPSETTLPDVETTVKEPTVQQPEAELPVIEPTRGENELPGI